VSTRVFVVDDHPVFRDGLVALLGSVEDLDVVGAAGDGPEAIEALSDGCADVVLMDLNLPTMSGIEATARLAALPDPPAVLAVTMVDDDDTVLAAMRAGARGYVLKGSVGERRSWRRCTVAAGGAVFGAGVATQVLALASPGGGAGREDDGLTEREREVLALLAEGANNAQIARALGVSLKTVQNYVSRILDKLQVSDRTQAALKARGRPSSR